jgi:hypothetical protein
LYTRLMQDARPHIQITPTFILNTITEEVL